MNQEEKIITITILFVCFITIFTLTYKYNSVTNKLNDCLINQQEKERGGTDDALVRKMWEEVPKMQQIQPNMSELFAK